MRTLSYGPMTKVSLNPCSYAGAGTGRPVYWTSIINEEENEEVEQEGRREDRGEM